MTWQPIETAPREENYEDIIVSDGKYVCSAVLFEGLWLDSGHDFLDPQPTH